MNNDKLMQSTEHRLNTNLHYDNGTDQLGWLAKFQTPLKDEQYEVYYYDLKSYLLAQRICVRCSDNSVDVELTTEARNYATHLTHLNNNGQGLLSFIKEFVQSDADLPSDYDYQKDYHLRRAIYHKFDPQLNPKAYQVLLAQLSDTITFENTWGDSFFGKAYNEDTGEYEGLNYYGQLITMVRDQLRNYPDISVQQIMEWYWADREGNEIIGMPEDFPMVWALSKTGKKQNVQFTSKLDAMVLFYQKLGKPLPDKYAQQLANTATIESESTQPVVTYTRPIEQPTEHSNEQSTTVTTDALEALVEVFTTRLAEQAEANNRVISELTKKVEALQKQSLKSQVKSYNLFGNPELSDYDIE